MLAVVARTGDRRSPQPDPALTGTTDRLVRALFPLLERLEWSPEQLADHRRDALAETLAFARQRSPWHRERLHGIDLDAIGPEDLSALPVMTKRDLMVGWDDIVTEPRLCLADARAHVERLDREGMQSLAGRWFVYTSGGTTGDPAVYCWSTDEMARWGASGVRWTAAAGFGPPQRNAWVGARSFRHPSAAAALLSGGSPDLVVPVDQPLPAIVERLNAIRPDSLSVVCSMLAPLTDEADAGRLVIPIDRIAAFGDVLDPEVAVRAEEVFGAPVIESYPTTDVGYIAHQAPGERGMYVNDDLMIVESVTADDRPAESDEEIDHLLITSLHQRTFPMIRYRMDDRVGWMREPGHHRAFRRIAHVDGRSDELFTYGTAIVHPHGFRSVLAGIDSLRDYEVRQTPTGADVALVAREAVDTGVIASELGHMLERSGVPAPQVTVRCVDALPRSPMGKRRRFVPVERRADRDADRPSGADRARRLQ